MINSKSVKEKVFDLGADICGIADISQFEEAPEGFHPCDIYSECKSVIVFGVHFPQSTLDIKTNSPYTFVRSMLVSKVDTVSFQLACHLEKKGVSSIPIPSSEPYDYWDAKRKHGRGILSLKHSGYLAGLGQIGKNTLLINKNYGNMMWLGAVLTSIQLEADEIICDQYCDEECRLCIDSCPESALDGKTINQKLCRKRSHSFTDGGGWVLSCNICRQVCPQYNGVN